MFSRDEAGEKIKEEIKEGIREEIMGGDGSEETWELSFIIMQLELI